MPEESSAELLGASSYEIVPVDVGSVMPPRLNPGLWLPAGSCLGFSPPAQGIRRSIYTRHDGHIVAVRYRTEDNHLTVFIAQRP
ncbi:MAG TPA: hypothetical protein VIL85_10120 [Thermomicrobiales bacterium]|jgi:hypothetical protein